MKIQLSDYFTYKKLLCFTIPSIVMMFFANLFNTSTTASLFPISLAKTLLWH